MSSRRPWFPKTPSPGVDAQLVSTRWRRNAPQWSQRDVPAIPDRSAPKTVRPSRGHEATGCTEYVTTKAIGNNIPRPCGIVSFHPSDLAVHEGPLVYTQGAAARGAMLRLTARLTRTDCELAPVCLALHRAMFPPSPDKNVAARPAGFVSCLTVRERRALTSQTVVIGGAPLTATDVHQRAGDGVLLPAVLSDVATVPDGVGLSVEVITHAVVVRRIDEGRTYDLTDALGALEAKGFVNYFPPARLDVHARHHYDFARCVMQGDSRGAVEQFLRSQALVHKSLWPIWNGTVLDRPVAALAADKKALKSVMERVEALGEPRRHRTTMAVLAALENLNPVYPAILARAVPRGQVTARVQCASELAFNALCSLRVRVHGRGVVVGDLVVPPGTVLPGTREDVAADARHPETPHFGMYAPRVVPLLVATEAMAAQYTFYDVVMPVPYFLGRPDPARSPILWPTHSIDKVAYTTFLDNVAMSQLLGPHANVMYRRVAVRPRALAWELHASNNGIPMCTARAGAEGWAVVDSDGLVRLGTVAPERLSSDDTLAPEALKGLYAAPSIALKVDLPHGSHLWAALREVLDTRLSLRHSAVVHGGRNTVCYKCGSPDHTMSACPSTVGREPSKTLNQNADDDE